MEHKHESIITPEEFNKVQTELAQRKRIIRQYSGKSIFLLTHRLWGVRLLLRIESLELDFKAIWQCNDKFKGEHKCETPHLDEETIKALFVAALNAIIESKNSILEDCRLMQKLEEIDVVPN